MNTALSRVENLLQNSELGLTIQKITQMAGVTEKEAKTSIKTLHAMGQIEMIPTPGRWGPRYAWLAAKPIAAEPPAIPDEDLAAGVQATITGDGSGETLPEIPMLEGTAQEIVSETVAAGASGLTGASGGPTTGGWGGEALPTLSDNIQEAVKAFAGATSSLFTGALGGPISLPSINADTLMAAMEGYRDIYYRNEPTRYAVAVPRRPLRVVKTRARAEALALAAVRRGAKGAEVFALTAVGRAKRDASFVEKM